VLVTTSEVMVEVGDKKDRQAGLWTYDGLVFTEVGGDFLANARYQITHLGDYGGDLTTGGYKTFTMPDGSKIVAQYRPTEDNPPVTKGEWEFLSGTDRYHGTTGSGTFQVLPDPRQGRVRPPGRPGQDPLSPVRPAGS
jgi:hypothetical protein